MTADIPTFRVERQRTESGSAFQLIGRLEGAAIRTVERLLSGQSSDGSVVRLDLGGLVSCDEAGVALLLALTKRAHMAAGDLQLEAVSDEIQQMFRAENVLQKLHVVPRTDTNDRVPVRTRYLYRAGESVPFAYASSRRDYSLVSDDTVWAHDSHDWLLAAGSGAVLAHQTRGSYFSPDTGDCLYTDQPADAPRPASPSHLG
jgi:ABC-type transporter Mla MlaB component